MKTATISETSVALANLEREGRIRRGTGKASLAVLESIPVRPASGADLLKALLEEREEGR